MKKVKKTKHAKALVTGLKSIKKYEFKVMATNAMMISLAREEESKTEHAKVSRVALCVGAGAIFSPLLIGGAIEGATDSELSTVAQVGLYAVTVPIGLLLSPITVPITAVIGVFAEIESCNKGDLTPVYENEE